MYQYLHGKQSAIGHLPSRLWRSARTDDTPVSTLLAWICNGSFRYKSCSGRCFAFIRNVSYPPVVKHPESDHGFWKSEHARKSTGHCILGCGTNIHCHPAMDQAGYDKILWNRRLDDFVFDGQYIPLVKLFLYSEVWLNTQISSILMSAMLLNGKSHRTMAASNLISWPVQSHSIWIWNAWNWHRPKAKSGHRFEGTGKRSLKTT